VCKNLRRYRATKFEVVMTPRSAKAPALTIPPRMRADEMTAGYAPPEVDLCPLSLCRCPQM
jgi:hypothetical protein